jgi:hypothetical protein
MFIERFIEYLDNKRIAPTRAEKDLGLGNGYIGKQRDRRGGIGSHIIEKIVEVYPDVDLNYLITGRKLSILNSKNNSITKNNGIPYYELLPASAGDLTPFLSDAKPTSYIDLPQITDCIAVLPVYGSSMKGVIEPGDLIAIKEVMSRIEFDPAMPYLIITNEHRMIKYLHLDEEDDTIVLAESVNIPRIRLYTGNILKVYAIKCVIRLF